MDQRALLVLLFLACNTFRGSTQRSSCQPRTLAADGQLATGFIAPGGCSLFTLQLQPSCTIGSYLHVDMWDLGGLSATTSSSSPLDSYSSDRADPLLGMSQDASFSASYGAAGTWQVQPPGAAFDEKGYELLRHYMRVQQQLGGNATTANRTWCACPPWHPGHPLNFRCIPPSTHAMELSRQGAALP